MPKYYSDDEFYTAPEGYYGSEREYKDRAYFAANCEQIMKTNRDFHAWRGRAVDFLMTTLGPRIIYLGHFGKPTMREEYVNILHLTQLAFQFEAGNTYLHARMLRLIDALQYRVKQLTKEVVEAEEICDWSSRNPLADHAEFCAWFQAREQAKARKTHLRDKRLRRATRKEAKRG